MSFQKVQMGFEVCVYFCLNAICYLTTDSQYAATAKNRLLIYLTYFFVVIKIILMFHFILLFSYARLLNFVGTIDISIEIKVHNCIQSIIF